MGENYGELLTDIAVDTPGFYDRHENEDHEKLHYHDVTGK